MGRELARQHEAEMKRARPIKRQGKSLKKHLEEASEGTGIAALSGLGIKHAVHNAIHRHLYENDSHYRRSYDAYSKTTQNAMKRAGKKLVGQANNHMATVKAIIKGSAKVAKKL